jgi:hypothetical protein
VDREVEFVARANRALTLKTQFGVCEKWKLVCYHKRILPSLET